MPVASLGRQPTALHSLLDIDKLMHQARYQRGRPPFVVPKHVQHQNDDDDDSYEYEAAQRTSSRPASRSASAVTGGGTSRSGSARGRSTSSSSSFANQREEQQHGGHHNNKKNNNPKNCFSVPISDEEFLRRHRGEQQQDDDAGQQNRSRPASATPRPATAGNSRSASQASLLPQPQRSGSARSATSMATSTSQCGSSSAPPPRPAFRTTGAPSPGFPAREFIYHPQPSSTRRSASAVSSSLRAAAAAAGEVGDDDAPNNAPPSSSSLYHPDAVRILKEPLVSQRATDVYQYVQPPTPQQPPTTTSAASEGGAAADDHDDWPRHAVHRSSSNQHVRNDGRSSSLPSRRSASQQQQQQQHQHQNLPPSSSLSSAPFFDASSVLEQQNGNTLTKQEEDRCIRAIYARYGAGGGAGAGVQQPTNSTSSLFADDHRQPPRPRQRKWTATISTDAVVSMIVAQSGQTLPKAAERGIPTAEAAAAAFAESNDEEGGYAARSSKVEDEKEEEEVDAQRRDEVRAVRIALERQPFFVAQTSAYAQLHPRAHRLQQLRETPLLVPKQPSVYRVPRAEVARHAERNHWHIAGTALHSHPPSSSVVIAGAQQHQPTPSSIASTPRYTTKLGAPRDGDQSTTIAAGKPYVAVAAAAESATMRKTVLWSHLLGATTTTTKKEPETTLHQPNNNNNNNAADPIAPVGLSPLYTAEALSLTFSYLPIDTLRGLSVVSRRCRDHPLVAQARTSPLLLRRARIHEQLKQCVRSLLACPGDLFLRGVCLLGERQTRRVVATASPSSSSSPCSPSRKVRSAQPPNNTLSSHEEDQQQEDLTGSLSIADDDGTQPSFSSTTPRASLPVSSSKGFPVPSSSTLPDHALQCAALILCILHSNSSSSSAGVAAAAAPQKLDKEEETSNTIGLPVEFVRWLSVAQQLFPTNEEEEPPQPSREEDDDAVAVVWAAFLDWVMRHENVEDAQTQEHESNNNNNMDHAQHSSPSSQKSQQHSAPSSSSLSSSAAVVRSLVKRGPRSLSQPEASALLSVVYSWASCAPQQQLQQPQQGTFPQRNEGGRGDEDDNQLLHHHCGSGGGCGECRFYHHDVDAVEVVLDRWLAALPTDWFACVLHWAVMLCRAALCVL